MLYDMLTVVLFICLMYLKKLWYIGPIVYYSYPYSYGFLEAKMVESFR